MHCITEYSVSDLFATFVRLSGVISIIVWSQLVNNLTVEQNIDYATALLRVFYLAYAYTGLTMIENTAYRSLGSMF